MATKSPAKVARKSSSAKPATLRNGRPTVDLRRAVSMVMELMAIEGGSGQEKSVADYTIARLRAAGASGEHMRFDDANKRTPIAGQTGNLIFKLPGTLAGPRRLLMAHMDTVPICIGSKPVRKGNFVRSANPATGLGADDRSGVAVILNTAIEILTRRLEHPPLTFLFVVQEEVGLHGAHFARVPLLGKPRLAFNWDGGPADKITIGATGGYRMEIEIDGLAAHAGGAPEQGVSAIAIASLAIADLVRDGWHGLIEKDGNRGTSNVGVIHGGAATNVVTDRVQIHAEARSHDPKFRKQIIRRIEKSFQDAAKHVKSATGAVGKVRINGRLDYEAFRLPDDEPAVLAAEHAVKTVGLTPTRAISNGGLDANWMTAHGIPTVTLGCGQMQIHTVSEQLDIGAFEKACEIALMLATEK